MEVVIARRHEGVLSSNDLSGMHHLRYQVFRKRLNWEVPTEGELEQDEYDALTEVTYMVVRDNDRNVIGCWRLLPTTGPNMLANTFPQLLCGHEMPHEEGVWELSRFATARHDRAVAGFTSAMPLLMMKAVVDFARKNGIKRYVTVTTVAIERMLRCLGVNVSRIGDPAVVGIERAVALTIQIDAKTTAAVFREADADITDHLAPAPTPTPLRRVA